MTSPLTKDLKNINIDTVENCNLLCKLVMDYMSTDKCKIDVLDDFGELADEKKKRRSFRIVYPEGSFINYRDTNYELTYAYFFYPSRHSVDGERYDLEVNIYHGIFEDSTGEKKGIVAHTHYHNDDNDSNTNQHKHFHYHLPDDANDNKAHDTTDNDIHINKNVVTCLLYNMGKHIGNDVNIFFNQFIHHPDFKRIKTKNNLDKFDVDVHDNWTIEKIYPKKRSYFMYDDGDNTYVIFDTIQTISKEIIDRIYERGIKGAYNNNEGFDLNSIGTYTVNNATDVLYRKNIEVITDEQYKKTKRAQIKDLLSLSRMSTYKPTKTMAKEYNEMADKIIKSFSGGSNTGYLTSAGKAKIVADLWGMYGKGTPKEIRMTDVTNENIKKIIFNSEYLKKYDYLKKIYKRFKDKDPAFDENDSTYLDERKEVLKKKNFLNLDDHLYDQLDILNPGSYITWSSTNAAKFALLSESDRKKINDFFNDQGNKTQDDYNNFKNETLTFSENLSNQSAFFFYSPSDAKENEKKLRFFFEELTPGWNAKHGIDSNIISKLNEDGQEATLTAMVPVFNYIKGEYPELANELIFLEEGQELTRTLSNEECQQWMSNETHYEGDLWKFWDKPPIIRPGSDPRTFDKLSMDERRKIGEGMMEYTNVGEPDTLQWKPHNKCRNPGNRAAAPWCYTKNPNKRWEYCAKPQYSNILGKIILFLIFVFVGVIAFFTIKKLFFYEYPMRFVAKITGGTLATKDTFTAAPGATQPPSK